MKFSIDYKIQLGDSEILGTVLEKDVASYREQLAEISSMTGEFVLHINNKEAPADYADPLIKLADGWLRKLPWIIGGDTETVALRNSAQCFAFVPTGDGVEISFFDGDETEIEDYVMDPTNVRLEEFATESIRLGSRLLALAEAIDANLLESDEDCRDLGVSLEEARRAWKEYLVHQRR
ncbi:MAG: hypothetical protein R3C68_19065 [Myxococcota bacterium]